MPNWGLNAERLNAACVKNFAVRDANGDSTVTYTPEGEAVFTIDATFERNAERVSLQGGQMVQSKVPILGVHLPDFDAASRTRPRRGDALTVGAESFVVRIVEPDSEAIGADLILQAV